jgi:hypothetical protein
MLAMLDDTGTVPVLQFDPFAKLPPLPFVQLIFAMIDQPLCLLVALLKARRHPRNKRVAVCQTL